VCTLITRAYDNDSAISLCSCFGFRGARRTDDHIILHAHTHTSYKRDRDKYNTLIQQQKVAAAAAALRIGRKRYRPSRRHVHKSGTHRRSRPSPAPITWSVRVRSSRRFLFPPLPFHRSTLGHGEKYARRPIITAKHTRRVGIEFLARGSQGPNGVTFYLLSIARSYCSGRNVRWIRRKHTQSPLSDLCKRPTYYIS